jgi:hypothetical protein
MFVESKRGYLMSDLNLHPDVVAVQSNGRLTAGGGHMPEALQIIASVLVIATLVLSIYRAVSAGGDGADAVSAPQGSGVGGVLQNAETATTRFQDKMDREDEELEKRFRRKK